jgi:CRP/FNR family transcriptional regulator
MILDKLKNIDIFRSIDEESLKKITAFTYIKELPKDGVLFYEGDEPKYIYALISGHLKLYKTGFKNNEIVLHYFTTSCLVAEMTALESINFPATAVAMQDSTQIALIDKDKFLNLLKSDNSFSFLIIKSLTKKIKNLEVTIQRNLVFDSTLRICSLLQEDANIFKTLKSKEIASILNMTPETVSRILKKLKKFEILDEKNILKDKEKLEMFLELQ